jgi:hypothetical protein
MAHGDNLDRLISEPIGHDIGRRKYQFAGARPAPHAAEVRHIGQPAHGFPDLQAQLLGGRRIVGLDGGIDFIKIGQSFQKPTDVHTLAVKGWRLYRLFAAAFGLKVPFNIFIFDKRSTLVSLG